MHTVDDGHDTPCSIADGLELPLGLGVDWIDHSVPFHRSASVSLSLELFSYHPAAVHAVVDERDVSKVNFLPSARVGS